MLRKIIRVVITVLIAASIVQNPVFAAESADALIEKARTKAQEIEKFKKILNEETDQNVRLAAFDAMINSEDPTTIEVAIASGLGSADKLLQEAAFKAAVLNLESLNIKIKPDTSVSEELQKEAKDYIDKNGDQYLLSFGKKDIKKGVIEIIYGGASGMEIVGSHITFTRHVDKGTLSLTDGDTIEGEIITNSNLKFLGTAKIR